MFEAATVLHAGFPKPRWSTTLFQEIITHAFVVFLTLLSLLIPEGLFCLVPDDP